MMSGTFHLIDLRTQAEAVNCLLAGWPAPDKLAWLQRHGTYIDHPYSGTAGRYIFESGLHLFCAFTFDNDEIIVW